MILNEQNILITGGASGIGKALVAGLLQHGAKVIVIDQNLNGIKSLVSEFPDVAAYAADLTDIEQVKSVVGNIYHNHERINVLVNNAGVIHSEPLINLLSPEDKKHQIDTWKKTIDINLNAVFYLTAHIAEQMVTRRHKGVIINISSIAATGNAGQSAYSATKAAVNALTVSWSKELGMFGIRCNSIAPGFMDTPSTQNALSEAKIKQYQKNTPLGRLGKTEEILHALEFIIENDFYNGAILQLDGGLKL
ncbi:MAG: SDR family NAD(P)-dependent oxidoreductase [Bacteroidota bacterium]|nr:SDR family NAD(P)-dependent oxidoreductase [Bacteroidota bacterium]